MKHAIKALFVEKAVNEQGEEVFYFQASVGTKDREGEIVTADGWDFGNYLKNPVFIVAHDHTGLPVGKTVFLEPNDTGFKIGVVFDDEDPAAVLVKSKYQRGFLNAVSAGFTRLQTTGKRAGKDWVTTKKELLEVSACAVPMHPDALMVRKSLAELEEQLATKSADFQTELSLDQLRSQNWDRKWKLERALERSNDGVLADTTLTRDEKLAAIGTNLTQYAEAMLAWYGDKMTIEDAMAVAGVKAGDGEDVAKKALEFGAKAGRTLSKKNEEAIRTAMGGMDDCKAMLAGVLESMGKPAEGEEPPEDDQGDKAITTGGASQGAPSPIGEVAITADLSALMAFVGNKEEN